MTDEGSLLRALLAASAVVSPIASIDEWWARQRPIVHAQPTPIDAAIAAGFAMDRVGYAFASGYHAALRALAPPLAIDAGAAFCATEIGGAKPDQIATTLTARDGAFVLAGTKSFVTLGEHAAQLLVVARAGDRPDGRADLRVVLIPKSRAGVTMQAGPETPFAPEITHASLALADVRVEPSEVLAGDGYAAYLKPFRTIEDIHVYAAALAYLVGVSRRHGEGTLVSELASTLLSLRALAALPPFDPTTHVALAGALATGKRLVESLVAALADHPSEERDRLRRDQPLFSVAERVRDMRLAAAKRALASTG